MKFDLKPQKLGKTIHIEILIVCETKTQKYQLLTPLKFNCKKSKKRVNRDQSRNLEIKQISNKLMVMLVNFTGQTRLHNRNSINSKILASFQNKKLSVRLLILILIKLITILIKIFKISMKLKLKVKSILNKKYLLKYTTLIITLIV